MPVHTNTPVSDFCVIKCPRIKAEVEGHHIKYIHKITNHGIIDNTMYFTFDFVLVWYSNYVHRKTPPQLKVRKNVLVGKSPNSFFCYSLLNRLHISRISSNILHASRWCIV